MLPVDQVPLLETGPCQPPAAVHVVALVEFHVKVEVPPLLTVVGEAISATAGPCWITVTSIDWETEPLAPVQVSV